MDSAASSICQLCREGPFAAQLGLFDVIVRDSWPGKLKYVGGFAYSTSRAFLELSAPACSWCRVLLGMCEGQNFDPDDPLTITLGKSAEWESSISSHCSPNDIQGLMVIINGCEVFRGYVHTAADDPAAAYIVARSPVLDVGSPHALALAKKLLDECDHEHVERCAVLSDSRSLSLSSTRLIDCTNPSLPRLVISTNLPSKTKYLALSYVWGGEQPYSTCLKNVSAYEKGIDVACLPQTLQDAIRVTDALGFQYLWADSLCIIQDSGMDKIHELGRMAQIYRGAFLTIIAASARSASEGFLQTRPAPLHDIILPFPCFQHPTSASAPSAVDGPTPGKQAVGRICLSPVYTHATGEIRLYSHAQEPVNERAWCMQEHLMSQRALIFTSETLQFRCHTSTKNIGSSFYDTRGERRLPDALFLRDAPSMPCSSAEWQVLHQAWIDIVEDYSRRSAKWSSDKLVACGAITKEFHRVLKRDYLAGLWRYTFLSDLLWLGPKDCRAHPPPYRAPSWSWASVDGQVEMEPYLEPPQRIPLSEVLGCKVTLKNNSLPFGEVTDGALVLRTPALVRCTLHDGSGPGEYCVQLHTARAEWDLPPTGEVRDRGLGDVAPNIDYFGAARVDRIVDATLRHLWAVPLTQKGGILEGLLVTVAHSDWMIINCWRMLTRSIRYRRVGLFHIPADGLYALKLPGEGLKGVKVTIV
ncbi:heterokaryon incompatibility protein-domain-containing protein [Lenzites betulinus]|nr:heterokaryon incompatibility protein-domain-containing protein [Lenzites betulinus]